MALSGKKPTKAKQVAGIQARLKGSGERRLNVRMSDDQYRRYRHWAYVHGCSLSDLTKAALEQFIVHDPMVYPKITSDDPEEDDGGV